MGFARFKRKVRKLILGHDVTTYYFSQGGEDAILASLFNKKLSRKEPGFFVDVGAYHPYQQSNTYSLYINGWSGINIDAQPGSMELFDKVRPRDINLEIGISDANGTLTYYMLGKQSKMNSFSKEHLQELGVYSRVKKEIEIPVKTLRDVLGESESHFDKIDLLTIDAEGLDFSILKSNNWERYRPDVIVIEALCATLDDVAGLEITQFLQGHGYSAVAKNVVLRDTASIFFVAKDFDY